MGEREIQYLTLEEASEICKIPVRTLRKRISEGLLPAYKPSRSVLIDLRELEIFMKRSRIMRAV